MKSRKFDPEKLGKELAEYGSLHDVIEALKRARDSLRNETDNLQKNKALLASEVETLSNKKNYLAKEIENLENINRELNRQIKLLQNKNEDLINSRDRLEREVLDQQVRETDLRQHNHDLADKQKEMEEKLTALPEIQQQYEERSAKLTEIELKIRKVAKRFEFFESFLAFVNANTLDDVEKFFNEMPRFIDTAREGTWDIQAVKEVIFKKFTGGIFDVMKCMNCATEFIVVKTPNPKNVSPIVTVKTEPKYCPVCESPLINAIKPFSATLKEQLKKDN